VLLRRGSAARFGSSGILEFRPRHGAWLGEWALLFADGADPDDRSEACDGFSIKQLLLSPCRGGS